MKSAIFPVVLGMITFAMITNECIRCSRDLEKQKHAGEQYLASLPADTVWRGWNSYQIPRDSKEGALIYYGFQLISTTAEYFGPKGTVAPITNGMNCQNCHLNGGTIPFGNNFGKVYSTYPKFRARNNGIQTIYARINDCFQRSLNGKAIDTQSTEMKAIYAYIKWLGEDVPKGVEKGGTTLMKLPYLDRAADPSKGAMAYVQKCESCHGKNGEGQISPDGKTYTYPPLWGTHSYNDGAGLYRISNLASFIKNNMPFGTDYHTSKLTIEESWDLAAFINNRPRPHFDARNDWKDISKKPIDHPFGPYADKFSEDQHKFGPFKPIIAAKNSNRN